MKQTLFRLSLGLAAVALVAACGGGGGESTAPPAAAPAAAPAPVAAAPAGSGSITGLVSYSGEDTDAAIDMNADPVCADLHEAGTESETIVASDGNLANVFVYVKEGVSGSYPPPAEPLVLDQQGCAYHPHVTGLQTGQTLVIRNSDPTLHNVHAMPTKNPEFNQGQPFQNMELQKTFDQAEIMIRFKCDVHPWMSAYMGVVAHPFFAVTGADGSFTIEGLPAGDYVVESWHESLGAKTQAVTVGDGAVAVAFDYDA
ncbi:MAG: carboxypeptidase regulatory-like domain-containing protein [Acidobacteriota bacterium]|nr:carboxypeptidase regulatory-like domain-containing protein [Acidobacteriota bacterium]